ncbi:hypothetical protein ACQP0C_27085 [Nocardia sp. CA-129566]|uniref:hypothetical protein n=1 Tax=Nocardia sp. CA-129566 TaxID=3239976 RepID=UPI003D957069
MRSTAALARPGFGVIGFTALAQGMPTSKYLDGIPPKSRATQGKSFQNRIADPGHDRAVTQAEHDRGSARTNTGTTGQGRCATLTSLAIGASTTDQLDQNVAALDNLDFDAAELADIDTLLDNDGEIDLWQSAHRGAL